MMEEKIKVHLHQLSPSSLYCTQVTSIFIEDLSYFYSSQHFTTLTGHLFQYLIILSIEHLFFLRQIRFNHYILSLFLFGDLLINRKLILCTKCLGRLKFVVRISIFCKYTSYKVNLTDYRRALELLTVQYIVPLTTRNLVEWKLHN